VLISAVSIVKPDLERAVYSAGLTDAEVVAYAALALADLEYAHRARAEAAHAEMMRRLVVALQSHRRSSDRAARRLIWLTIVLVAMTSAILWLTYELAQHPGAG
jgi:hypothetical protein